MKSVYSAVRTGSLNKAVCASSVKGLIPIFFLTVEGSRSHTIRHTHTHTEPVGLLWTSDQLVAEAATYTINIR